MPIVNLKHTRESFDSLLRRFKKAVDRENTLRDAREKEFFEKPSNVRKRARASAKKRLQKKVNEERINTKRLY